MAIDWSEGIGALGSTWLRALLADHARQHLARPRDRSPRLRLVSQIPRGARPSSESRRGRCPLPRPRRRDALDRRASRARAHQPFDRVAGAQERGLRESRAHELESTGRPPAKPQGTEIPGTPARFAGTVKTSARYISRGFAVFSPSLKADDGVVGVAMTSHDAKAVSKSRRMRVRTFWARR